VSIKNEKLNTPAHAEKRAGVSIKNELKDEGPEGSLEDLVNKYQ